MSVWDRLRAGRTAGWIRDQIASGEVAHAWLLLGPAGSGKRSVATAMAAALNCRTSPNVGCGECSACRRTLRQRHPDVHHVQPEGPLIPVAVVREQILPEAARSAFEGPWKVFVMEEADRMNDEAQNALLKTLEEPQPDTVFILLTDHEHELLETIRSRCRAVRLEPVPEEWIVELLTGEGAPQPTALLAARVSEGDFERARRLAFDDIDGERRRLWLGIPRRLASPVDALDAAAEILAEAKQAMKGRERAQAGEVADLAEAIGAGRGTAQARGALARRHKRELRRLEEEVLGDALQTLGSFYRDVLACRSAAQDTVANLDTMDDIESFGATHEISDAALVAAVEACVRARKTLPRNANAQLQIEACLLDIARLIPAPARTSRTEAR